MAFVWVCLAVGLILIAVGTISNFVRKSTGSATADGWKVHWPTHAIVLGSGLILGDGLSIYHTARIEKKIEERADLRFQQFAENIKGGLSKMNEAELVATLRPLAGTPEIAQLVAESVLNGDVYYQEYVYQAEVHYLDPRSVAPELAENNVEIVDSLFIKVHNPTNHTVEYPLSLTVIDLPATSNRQLGFEELTTERFDDTGRNIASQHEDRTTFRGSFDSDPSRGVTRLNKQVRIGPHESAGLTIRSRNWDRKRRGQIAMRTRYKALGMLVKVTFPDESFQRQVHFGHPAYGDAATCVIEQGSPIQTTARIERGLLPYNGITITWDRDALSSKSNPGSERERSQAGAKATP